MKYLPGIKTLIFGLSVALVSMGGMGLAEETTPEAEPLHILVGKSVVINMQTRLKRVLVSNPVVIEGVATSPTQVVVEAKAAGTSSLILWDETGRSRMLDVMVDVDVSGLRTAIERAYPNQKIQAQADGGRLILSGTVADQHAEDDLVKMAGIYSKDIVDSLGQAQIHDRQILLEVKIAEIDRTRLNQLGFNIFSTGAGNTPGIVTTQQFGPPSGTGAGETVTGTSHGTTTTFNFTNLLNLFLFRPDINLGATVEALETKNVLQILAEPNLLALNGKKASFLAGGEFPVPIVQGGQAIGVVTIQFRPFGVRLDFTGYINADNTIRLQVAPEVSTLDFTNAVTISGFTVPALSTRRAETEIELRDGQAFGIAGLLDQRVQDQLNKIPGIGDIPILGQLFRSKSVQKSRSELLVLVTPHIVDPVRTGAQMASQIPKPAEPYLKTPGFDHSLPGHKELGSPSPESTPKQIQ
ncbi:MAG TPA: type II and III secretion system protein family protein [Terriglobia bacterium]|nr:type II and III secretion system protein family protein [Terriglobia bacterium]